MIDDPTPDPTADSSLERLPLEDLRERRAAYVEQETGLSYLRRMVQGPLDIVRSELARRELGTGSDLAGLVDDLPNLLTRDDRIARRADALERDGVDGMGAKAPGMEGAGRLPEMMEPTHLDPELVSELDALLVATPVSSVTQLGEAELVDVVVELEGFERKVSERRRALHGEIDSLQAELTRRYRTGEADVETLLG